MSRAVLYKIDPHSMQVDASVGLPLTGSTWASQFWTTYNGMRVLADGSLVLKGFHLVDDVGVPRVLLSVDPGSLEVGVQQEATASSSRLMIDQNPEGPDCIYPPRQRDVVPPLRDHR